MHSLILIEPPPVHVPSAAEFRAANAGLQESRRRAGVAAALDEFMTLLMGQHWRSEMQRNLPGSVTQMERDAASRTECGPSALATRSRSTLRGIVTGRLAPGWRVVADDVQMIAEGW